MRGTTLLARHGSHSEVGDILSGRSEIPLSDAGRAEAQRLASRLAGTALRAVQASPRRRCLETARIVAAPHGLEVEIVAALDEIDFGEWMGQPFAALAERADWRRWNEARATAPTPGGETMAQAIARAVDHVERIGGEGPTLCVTHCDIIRGVVAHYLGLSADRLLAFDCDPASLTIIEAGRVKTVNERPQ